MKLTEVTDALKAVMASDAPTSTRGAGKLAKGLTTDALKPLREWQEELSNYLEEAEQSILKMTEADTDDDRDLHHETLAGNASDLYALLTSLSESN